MNRDGAARPLFPPRDQAVVTAIAREAVAETTGPLSRQSWDDRAPRARHALGKPIRRRTAGRILQSDAIQPWRDEPWIAPRDPKFAEEAGVILDLSAGLGHGQRRGPKDHLISGDATPRIQARIRSHPSLAPAPRRPRRVEHEEGRGGALPYRAAGDVRRGSVMGRGAPKTGIAPFGRWVAQVLEREPYRSADRVSWVVDTGSSHRGAAAARRLARASSQLILVQTPVHASWLNQVAIPFAGVQREVLPPNDVAGLDEVEQRLRLYETRTNGAPRPFHGKFDRAKLAAFLDRLDEKRRAMGTA